MKKNLLVLSAILFFSSWAYSQASFNTGALQVDVSEYGRIQLYNGAGVQQLERASILVGNSPTAVFDYTNDAETHDPTVLVDPPQISDFEIFGSYDNTYSNLPPDVLVKQWQYGWTNGNYIIVKFTITNNSEDPEMPFIFGMDIIPYLDEEYGYDSVTYNNTEGVIRFHRGSQTNMGVKNLTPELASLYSFEWYDGYSVDADYWTWMNEGSIQPLYASNTADGPVTITAHPTDLIPIGQSKDMFYAFALGATEEELMQNMAAAADKYNAVFLSVPEKELALKSVRLEKNYPNPFSIKTTINYELPSAGFVTLKVFDAYGNSVASLVEENQQRGEHSINFDGSKLSEGIYYCTLTFGNETRSQKISVAR